MDTGCKPTSVRFVGLLKSSTRGRIGTHALHILLPYVNFWKAQPFSLSLILQVNIYLPLRIGEGTVRR